MRIRIISCDSSIYVAPCGWKPETPSGYELLNESEGCFAWDPLLQDENDVLVMVLTAGLTVHVNEETDVPVSALVWETLDGETYTAVTEEISST